MNARWVSRVVQRRLLTSPPPHGELAPIVRQLERMNNTLDALLTACGWTGVGLLGTTMSIALKTK